jgi:hypothetical protein
MIYVLLLEQNKIYVGYSSRPDGERFFEHFNYNASKWTTKYRPIQVLQILEGELQQENELTLQMMDKYGWWNVRGGSWCKVEMNNCPTALLKLQNISIPKSSRTNKYFLNQNTCFKCGRTSHFAGSCYAKTHINGYSLL